MARQFVATREAQAATEQDTPTMSCSAEQSPRTSVPSNELSSQRTHARDFISEKPEPGVYDLVVWSRAESFTGVMYRLVINRTHSLGWLGQKRIPNLEFTNSMVRKTTMLALCMQCTNHQDRPLNP